MTADDDLPVTIPELARIAIARGIPIGRHTLYRLARDGTLPVTRVGRIRSTMRALLSILRPRP